VFTGLAAIGLLLLAAFHALLAGTMVLSDEWLLATSQLIGLAGAVMLFNTARTLASTGEIRALRTPALLGTGAVALALAIIPRVNSVLTEAKMAGARRAAMNASLEHIVAAESAHFATHGKFIADVQQLSHVIERDTRIKFLEIDGLTGSAVVEHRNTTRTCSLSWVWSEDGLSRIRKCEPKGRWRKNYPEEP
jgi:membrane-bound ClpP family serine protease